MEKGAAFKNKQKHDIFLREWSRIFFLHLRKHEYK